MNRFIDNNNGTITDTKTGLIWDKEGSDNTYTWEETKEYADKLSIAGLKWRVPTIEELFSIIDYNKINPIINHIFGCKSSFYWSSSTYVYATNYAWYVCFSYGYVDNNSKTSTSPYYVRCVSDPMEIENKLDNNINRKESNMKEQISENFARELIEDVFYGEPHPIEEKIKHWKEKGWIKKTALEDLMEFVNQNRNYTGDSKFTATMELIWSKLNWVVAELEEKE